MKKREENKAVVKKPLPIEAAQEEIKRDPSP